MKWDVRWSFCLKGSAKETWLGNQFSVAWLIDLSRFEQSVAVPCNAVTRQLNAEVLRTAAVCQPRPTAPWGRGWRSPRILPSSLCQTSRPWPLMSWESYMPVAVWKNDVLWRITFLSEKESQILELFLMCFPTSACQRVSLEMTLKCERINWLFRNYEPVSVSERVFFFSGFCRFCSLTFKAFTLAYKIEKAAQISFENWSYYCKNIAP